MEKLEPLISVCIPCYNSEKYIAQTIQSVLDQSIQNWELIIVDNHSTDGTVKVVESFTDPRIRLVINIRNYGAPGNFNLATQYTRGIYTKLLCADDLLYPTCLEEQATIFQEYDNHGIRLSLVCSKRDFIDDHGEKLFSGKGFNSAGGRIDSTRAIKQIVRSGTNPIGEPASVLFRSDHFHKVGGFNENSAYMIDLDLWCRLLNLGDLYFIPKSLSAFRIASKSWSAAIGKSQAQQATLFFKMLARSKPQTISTFDLFISYFKLHLLAYLRQAFYIYLRYRK